MEKIVGFIKLKESVELSQVKQIEKVMNLGLPFIFTGNAFILDDTLEPREFEEKVLKPILKAEAILNEKIELILFHVTDEMWADVFTVKNGEILWYDNDSWGIL